MELTVDLGKSTEIEAITERFLSAFYAHNIREKDIPYYLKQFNFLGRINQEVIYYVAEVFELSKAWLMGHSFTVTESSSHFSHFEKLCEYLIFCKERGWDPRVIFLEAQDFSDSPLVLIELSKITFLNMFVTTYKQWDVEDWESVLYLCQKAGLPCKGLKVSAEKYEKLKGRTLIPARAIQEPLGFWVSKANYPVQNFSKKIQELADRIRYAPVDARWQGVKS